MTTRDATRYSDPAIDRMRAAVAELEATFGKRADLAELRALIEQLADAERGELAEREAEGRA